MDQRLKIKGGFLMTMKLLLVTVLLSFLELSVSSAQEGSTVTDEVKKVVDEVIRIVTNKDLKKPQNARERRAEMKKAIGSIFDYGQMTKLSMGIHSKDRNPAEQKELVKLFETLLENSYATKMNRSDDEKIIYLKEDVEGDYAEVSSRVITEKGDEFSLVYRLGKEGNKWMVYDVVIDGMSLVSNYRSQFNRIIEEQGYNELIKKLQTKSEEIKAR